MSMLNFNAPSEPAQGCISAVKSSHHPCKKDDFKCEGSGKKLLENRKRRTKFQNVFV